MVKKYKNKKGATGKKYTTYSDRIKVTYGDGSTRTVRPGDASYEATKKAMESDIGAKKWYKPAGNSKTTAETAIVNMNTGKSVNDGRGLVISGNVNRKAQQDMREWRKNTGRDSLTQARQVNAQVAAAMPKVVSGKALKSGVAQGKTNLVQGTKQGLLALADSPLVKFMAKAEATNAANYAQMAGSLLPNNTRNAVMQQASNAGKWSLEQQRRNLAQQTLQKQQAIANKYGPLNQGERIVSDVVANMIPMLPSIGAGMMTGGIGAAAGLGARGIQLANTAGSMGSMFNYARGMGEAQALNEGATMQQANNYGLATGALEAGTEMLIGGIPGLPSVGRILRPGQARALTAGIQNQTLKRAADAAIDIGGEGLEEAIAEAADPYIQRQIYNPDAENATAQDIARAAIMGMLTGGLMKGGAHLAGKAMDVPPRLTRAGEDMRARQQTASDNALFGSTLEERNAQQEEAAQINAENARKAAELAQRAQEAAEAVKRLPVIIPSQQAQNAPENRNNEVGFYRTGEFDLNLQGEAQKTIHSLPMKQRTFENVGNRKVKAYQQENPAVRPFYQETASNLLADLQQGTKGGRDVGINPETRNVTTRSGWQRQQAEPINRMLDDGMSYPQIEDGLQRIIEDHGKENTASAKRAELYVHDATVNGYRNVQGEQVQPNGEFAYRGQTLEQLQELNTRLDNAYTGDPVKDAAIIHNQEIVQNLMRKTPPTSVPDIRPRLKRPEPVQQVEQQNQADNTAQVEQSAPEPDFSSYEDYDISKLQSDVVDFYEQLGEVGGKAHFNVRIVQGIDKGADGMIDNQGNILLNGDNLTSVETIHKAAAHEVYHAMKGLEEHRDIQDQAYKHYLTQHPGATQEDMLREKIAQYYRLSGGKVGADITNIAWEDVDNDLKELAWDEVGAAFMGDALTDPAVADRIWNDNPSLFQRIARMIDTVLQKFQYIRMSKVAREQYNIYQEARKLYAKGLQSMQYNGLQQQDSQPRQMFAGEKSQTADLDALARAKQMAASGTDMERIRQETGWFRSKVTGGKWAYEIDDSKATYNPYGGNLWQMEYADVTARANELFDKFINGTITDEEYSEMEQLHKANLLIRNDADGKKYLYDLINIKKDSSSALARSYSERLYREQGSPADTTIFDKFTIPQNQRKGNSNIRYSLSDMADQYGAIPAGENPMGTNRDVQVPQQTSDFDKVRKGTRTGMEAEQVADETVAGIQKELDSDVQDGRFTYEPTSNKADLAEANKRIATNGWEETGRQLHEAVVSGQRINSADMATLERLIQEAQKAGQYDKAVDFVSDLAVIGTESGQNIQAIRILKRLTPEGQLMALKNAQRRINNSLIRKGQPSVPEISGEVAQEFLQARGNKKRGEIWDKEIVRMAQQTEGSWVDKLNAIRYAAMLSNPRTHFRNLIGNCAMQAARFPTNLISAALEDVTSLSQKRRKPNGMEQNRSLLNKTGQSRKELRKYAEMAWTADGEAAMRNVGNRYDDVSGQFAQNQRVFGHTVAGNVLEALAGNGKRSVGSVLDAEDMWFKHATYVNTLVAYMKANGITTRDAALNVVKPNGASIGKGMEYAGLQARKATFTEDNKLANHISKLENTNLGTQLALGAILPFKKTPMNIITRGVEYSPVGLLMTGYKLQDAVRHQQTVKEYDELENRYSKKKVPRESKYTVNDVLESLAANLTGSALLAAGIYFASQGMLAATGDDDDKRKENYDRQMGDQNFAVVLDDGSTYTIDWLAPAAMPLLTGVEVYNQLFSNKYDETDETAVSRAISAAGKIADPVFEMSCMQGVASALASYSGDAGDIASTLAANIGTGYAGQFIPAPVGALARVIDDTVRSSYAPKDSAYTKTVESFLRQQRSKVPGLSKQNEASIDVWGNERKREFADSDPSDVAMRVISNFISPGNYSSNKRTELDSKLTELYEATGDSAVLPKRADSYIKRDGEPTVYLSPQEYTRFSTTKGKKSAQYAGDFTSSDAYQNLDDTTKADIVGNLYGLANYEAKKEALKGRGVDYSDKAYESALESGVKPYEYYATKERFGGKWDNYDTVKEYAEYADKMGMQDSKYVAVYDSLGDLEADKDRNGKPISDSRKEKVLTYLNSERNKGNITKEQWWYFYTKEYPSQAKNAPYAWIREANKR